MMRTMEYFKMRSDKRHGRLKRVSFLENTSSVSFSHLPYFGALNLGKIYANSSGKILTSSSVLDHWESARANLCFMFESILFGPCAHMMKLSCSEKKVLLEMMSVVLVRGRILPIRDIMSDLRDFGQISVICQRWKKYQTHGRQKNCISF